ncbi:hypothetical protein C8R42DRAFT_646412 [Lentinula raphanica]|nr:hypothetical protein C8R42DRAFT_646412 [Lentinula raphanica]
MARRSRRALRALYAFRRSRPTSRADGPGVLYAYVDRGHFWKIGMTNNFTRRKEEWDRRCPSLNRIWMPPVAVRRRRRAGMVVSMGGHHLPAAHNGCEGVRHRASQLPGTEACPRYFSTQYVSSATLAVYRAAAMSIQRDGTFWTRSTHSKTFDLIDDHYGQRSRIFRILGMNRRYYRHIPDKNHAKVGLNILFAIEHKWSSIEIKEEDEDENDSTKFETRNAGANRTAKQVTQAHERGFCLNESGYGEGAGERWDVCIKEIESLYLLLPFPIRFHHPPLISNSTKSSKASTSKVTIAMSTNSSPLCMVCDNTQDTSNTTTKTRTSRCSSSETRKSTLRKDSERVEAGYTVERTQGVHAKWTAESARKLCQFGKVVAGEGGSTYYSTGEVQIRFLSFLVSELPFAV